MVQIQAERRRIMDACVARDADLTAALIHDHVTAVGRAIVEYMRQDGNDSPQE